MRDAEHARYFQRSARAGGLADKIQLRRTSSASPIGRKRGKRTAIRAPPSLRRSADLVVRPIYIIPGHHGNLRLVQSRVKVRRTGGHHTADAAGELAIRPEAAVSRALHSNIAPGFMMRRCEIWLGTAYSAIGRRDGKRKIQGHPRLHVVAFLIIPLPPRQSCTLIASTFV